ncbi:MAG: plastocyanin/azurin family copper-binding protein [Gemmatimonadales bacterium]
MMASNSRPLRFLPAAVLVAAWLVGCSGDGEKGSGPTPAALAAAKSGSSGDGQTGAAGHDLASPLQIVVTRDGAPAQGAVVTWSANGIGASMTPQVDTADASGISSSIWHLGSEVGIQAARAVVGGGADGSPVAFSATATGDTPAPPPPPPPPANEVTIQLLTSGGNRFEPANVTIPVGTKVTWTWVGGFHDVSSAGSVGFPGSGAPVSAPHSYSQTFGTPGTYKYFCSVHGSAASDGTVSGMSGTIVVQ